MLINLPILRLYMVIDIIFSGLIKCKEDGNFSYPEVKEPFLEVDLVDNDLLKKNLGTFNILFLC